jgi:hypothetical protein
MLVGAFPELISFANGVDVMKDILMIFGCLMMAAAGIRSDSVTQVCGSALRGHPWATLLGPLALQFLGEILEEGLGHLSFGLL